MMKCPKCGNDKIMAEVKAKTTYWVEANRGIRKPEDILQYRCFYCHHKLEK